MDTEPEFIKSLTNGAAQADGAAVAFEIETEAGQVHPFACNTADVEKIVSWMIGLGHLAGTQADAAEDAGDPAPKTQIQATPVPVRQAATAAGQVPGDVVIGFDMGQFDLAFSLPADVARSLHEALGRAISG